MESIELILKVIAAILAAVSVAYLIFDLRAYRGWKRDTEDPDDEAPAPKMNWQPLTLLALALCVLCFLIWADRQGDRMDELEAMLRSNRDAAAKQAEQNWQRIRELEESLQCFRSVETEVVSLDVEHKTLELLVKAVPRYAAEDASVRLRLEDRELELERREDGSYEALFTVPFGNLSYYREGTLVLQEPVQTKTQDASVSVSLEGDVLPRMFCGAAWRVENGRIAGVEFDAATSGSRYGIVSMYAELVYEDRVLGRKVLVGPDRAPDAEIVDYGVTRSYSVGFRLEKPLERRILEDQDSDKYQYAVHLHFDDEAGLHHDHTIRILEVREPTAGWYLSPNYEEGGGIEYSELEIITDDAGEELYRNCK